ncbi:MAG TPA: hypothetical protein VN811_02300 [Thermoanaerobaculia bacterium]|nr:hypothetical protein [Thermoanaerobaculia bacterium]
MARVVAKDRRRDDIADRLKEAIESRGFKVAKLERLMKRSRGYINDALRGQKRLSVELILEVMTKLNADPQEVFAPWHPQHSWHSEIAEGVGGDVHASAAPLPASLREGSLHFQALVLTLEDKRIVSVDEVAARLRRLRGSAA